jgi:hypothetical protein
LGRFRFGFYSSIDPRTGGRTTTEPTTTTTMTEKQTEREREENKRSLDGVLWRRAVADPCPMGGLKRWIECELVCLLICTVYVWIVRASPERTAEARQFYSGGAFTFIHYNIAYKQY